ncbi:Calx-beta domain-containing protein [Tautonia plasticadhaerens]|uniref:Calx-beta domain protein n=1 Tax=Tautonia plasticadhaerens TaxID=2527974 RepID=A0A518HC71_9BACT|nr:Calx-beta domain-containing protein [Tautonia plasticadhaerens]QDV38451.1 Calx-beta domain protein [Tautonia plasticadhaerens]
MSGQTGGGKGRRRAFRPGVERVEHRRLLATFVVTNTADSGPGTLRQAILGANESPGADEVAFAIPTSNAPGRDVPVPGFDLSSQTWRIELASPLPALTDTTTIDGFSQADTPLSFFYPEDVDEPSLVTSDPNSIPALDGNNAQIRVIIDGSTIDRSAFPTPTGLVIDASDSDVRGLVITGFHDGIVVPRRENAGNRIQGNSIGGYFRYLVDLQTGDPLPAPDNIVFAGVGNTGDGVVVNGTNTTVGGFNPQENNTITLSGGRGIYLPPNSEGHQIFGNQIGVLGPSIGQVYVQAGNGAEGVLIESAPGLLSSSHSIGGPVPGSGNVISANGSHGVRLVGPGATRNRIDGNYIGAAPGGGFLFGAGDPGNGGDGVFLNDAPSNRIGAQDDDRRNVIPANEGAGVRIAGPNASGNIVSGNFIGLVSDGGAVLGNTREGVRIESSATGNTVGGGNVISGNLRGVIITGETSGGNVVSDNFIGSDADGVGDLGNALEGVLIESSSGNRVTGDGDGSQILSGNNVGLAIVGPSSSGTVATGNFIGTDTSGTLELNNSLQGVLIVNSPRNTLGAPGDSNRNLISSNHWGVEIAGAEATGNVLQNNIIGTDITGDLPFSSEIDGVLIRLGASDNLVGGPQPEQGNVIAFSRRDGVRIEDDSIGNTILTNSIFENAGLGIHLVPTGGPGPGPNFLRPAPTITLVRSSVGFTNIQGTLMSVPLTTFRIQFFANATPDPSGRGEGERYLGETTVTTDAAGFVSYSADVAGAVQPGEFVTATATDPVGNTSEFSVGVAEQLGTVQFSMSVFVVQESSGAALVVVTRLGGSGGQASVDYATGGGTATPDVDYEPVSGTLTFDIGVDQQTFTVPLLDDELGEAEETVGLLLSSPAGAATLGIPSNATLRLVDDDQPGNVFFGMESYVVDETAGEATIAVSRSAGGGTVTVPYATTGGSAVPGVDYVPVSGTITFGPGETVRTFTVPVLFNGASSVTTSVGLAIGQPTGGAGLGEPSMATLTITNLDVPQVTSISAAADRRGFLRIVLGFNRDMIASRAEDLRNYGYSVQVPGHNRRIGTRRDLLIPLAPPQYDPATRTVTLTTLRPIRPGTPVLVLVNQVTDVPGAGVGVADERGILLDGNDDGIPGGTFSATLRSPRPTFTPRPRFEFPGLGTSSTWADRLREARLRSGRG